MGKESDGEEGGVEVRGFVWEGRGDETLRNSPGWQIYSIVSRACMKCIFFHLKNKVAKVVDVAAFTNISIIAR